MKRIKLYELRGAVSRSLVADSIGITPQMLGAIERGDRTPSLDVAKRIADYYGKRVDDIFFDTNRNDSCLKEPNIA